VYNYSQGLNCAGRLLSGTTYRHFWKRPETVPALPQHAA